MNEARLFGATLSHGEEETHALFAAGGAVEDRELEAGLACELLRDIGETLRSQDAGGFR